MKVRVKEKEADFKPVIVAIELASQREVDALKAFFGELSGQEMANVANNSNPKTLFTSGDFSGINGDIYNILKNKTYESTCNS